MKKISLIILISFCTTLSAQDQKQTDPEIALMKAQIKSLQNRIGELEAKIEALISQSAKQQAGARNKNTPTHIEAKSEEPTAAEPVDYMGLLKQIPNQYLPPANEQEWPTLSKAAANDWCMKKINGAPLSIKGKVTMTSYKSGSAIISIEGEEFRTAGVKFWIRVVHLYIKDPDIQKLAAIKEGSTIQATGIIKRNIGLSGGFNEPSKKLDPQFEGRHVHILNSLYDVEIQSVR